MGLAVLDHCLALLARHGVAPGEVLVNAHAHWPAIAAWAEARGVGLQVELPEVLGTGGGLRAARERLAPVFLILNGDILCDVDLGALLAAVPPGGAAMALRADPFLGAEAPVEADDAGIVRRMRSFAGAPGPWRTGTHFTGIHACSRELLDLTPEGFSCILRTAYTAVLPQGKVASILHRGLWVDIGSPQEYLDANLAALSGSLSTPGEIPAGWRRLGGNLIGPGSLLPDEAQLDGNIIGENVLLSRDARLRHCLVQDGLRVPPGEYHRAILYGKKGEVAQVLAVDGLTRPAV
jgi:NDP-sugar pyrophosphorylase family protein